LPPGSHFSCRNSLHPWNELHWSRSMAGTWDINQVAIVIFDLVVGVNAGIKIVFGEALLLGEIAVVLEPYKQISMFTGYSSRHIAAMEVGTASGGMELKLGARLTSKA